ncbi:PTS mannose transporter subunit IID [Rossellomorea sp. DUT-2]|uniref:PTS mannose transporter subunit IID n=1 Tax=Rossellomorea sp. DUT-2 TaxID=3412021 RepID=UPI003D1792C1
MKKDIFTLLGGFLTSVFLFLGTIGVSFDWFTQTSIDAFVFMAAAAGSLVLNLYAVWKNTHVCNRIKKNVLKKQELIKK